MADELCARLPGVSREGAALARGEGPPDENAAELGGVGGDRWTMGGGRRIICPGPGSSGRRAAACMGGRRLVGASRSQTLPAEARARQWVRDDPLAGQRGAMVGSPVSDCFPRARAPRRRVLAGREAPRAVSRPLDKCGVCEVDLRPVVGPPAGSTERRPCYRMQPAYRAQGHGAAG